MELQSLKPAKGSVKNRKRIARGVGSGHGRTATRGHKGAKSRSGFKNKRNFEGGQMPIQMRLPKIGFKNPNRQAYRVINVGQLEAFASAIGVSKMDLATMVEHKIVKKSDRVKVLGDGELSNKLEVEAHAFSASAQKAIEAAGGSSKVVEK